jgi:DoxX-like family
MDTTAPSTSPSKAQLWIGWILSALPFLMLALSGVMKIAKLPMVVQGFAHFGLPDQLMIGLGILELSCAIIYLIPPTSILGAILVTGYLGGAILTNLRVGESVIGPAALGVLAWGGLFLRDPRLRALIPLRS